MKTQLPKRWVAKEIGSDKEHEVYAPTDAAALQMLLKSGVGPRLQYLKEEPEELKKVEYRVTVGKKDYTVIANTELGAMQALAQRGLDVSKFRNVRRVC